MSHRRKVEDNQRLLKLYQETGNWFGAGVYYSDRKERLIRYSASRKKVLPGYLKKRSNKIVRHSRMRLHHGQYRKLYGYWWNLW